MAFKKPRVTLLKPFERNAVMKLRNLKFLSNSKDF
jgi:hypothetical protein